MNLDEQKIADIVERVVERLGPLTRAPSLRVLPPQAVRRETSIPKGTLGVYRDPDSAVRAAEKRMAALRLW